MVQNKFAIIALLASNNNWSTSQNGNYYYVWQKSLLHSLKMKFSPVPIAAPTWNFVGCYSGALVNIRNRTGSNTT